jgi:small subunit ribosomal protein S5
LSMSSERGGRGHGSDSNDEGSQYIDKTVYISRVAKVVKGGKRFSFSALVISGDGKGNVGVGLGKAAEVPDAIRKGTERARKSMKKICLSGSTIPYEVYGDCGPTKVLLKPAAPGTGVIAGAVVRSIAEAAGIKDIRTKCIGSSNPYNLVSATLEGLMGLQEPEAIARGRNTSTQEMGYRAY